MTKKMETKPSEIVDDLMKEINKPKEVKLPNLVTINSDGKVETIFSKVWRKLKGK